MSLYALHPLPLPGLARVTHRRHEDDRGAFSRLYCEESLGASVHRSTFARSIAH